MEFERLSLEAFRRRVVAGTFPQFSSIGEAITELGFVQADPIRCPARAQDLILRQRVDGYRAGDLEEDFAELDAEEGYLFAYGFMRPEVWEGLRHQPSKRLTKLEKEVLAAVGERGAVHPRDLDEQFGRKSVKNYWGGSSAATKRVLEDLHDRGLLRVCRREKGIRVYSLPRDVAMEENRSKDEWWKALALATVRVFGPTELRFLVSELRSHNYLVAARSGRERLARELVEEGHLSEVEVEGVRYLWIRDAFQSDVVEERVRILAPFDPLVRDRARFVRLWGWEYRFEAYVPAKKRIRGYYTLPLLWKDQVVGWANAKVEGGALQVDLGYEGKPPSGKVFRDALAEELARLERFLGLAQGRA